jgi:hypothetical protein
MTTVIDFSDYITEDASFGPFPVQYHPGYGFYRCKIHRHVTANIVNHIKREHQGEFTKQLGLLAGMLEVYPEADMSATIAACTVDNPHPNYIPGVRDQAAGHACLHCRFFIPLAKGVKDHITKKHGGASHKLGTDYKQVFLQALHAGSSAKWFPSTPPNSPPAQTSSTDLSWIGRAERRELCLARKRQREESEEVEPLEMPVTSGESISLRVAADVAERLTEWKIIADSSGSVSGRGAHKGKLWAVTSGSVRVRAGSRVPECESIMAYRVVSQTDSDSHGGRW